MKPMITDLIDATAVTVALVLMSGKPPWLVVVPITLFIWFIGILFTIEAVKEARAWNR